MKLKMRAIWGAVAGMTLTACGAIDAPGQLAPEPRLAQGLEAGCTALGEEFVEHTCEHVASGPFASVTASATESFSGTSPNINQTHKYNTITLPSAGASYTGTVKFVPGTTGSWALFLSQDITVTAKDSNGNTLTAALSDPLNSSPCGLTRALVFDLTKSATYRFTFTSSTSTVGASIEHVEANAITYFQDADVDSYGNPNVFTTTACTPPANYVLDDLDCNDSNSTINPGAVELTGNTVDENCNGSLSN